MKVENGAILKDVFPNVRYPNVIWAADNQSFYYSRNDAAENTGRQTCGNVYLHHVGNNNDATIFDWRSINELKQESCENVNLYSATNSDYLLVYVSRAINGYGGYLFYSR